MFQSKFPLTSLSTITYYLNGMNAMVKLWQNIQNKNNANSQKNNLEVNVITKRHVTSDEIPQECLSFCEHKNAGIISKHC